MPLFVNDSTIIDDNRNIVNAGIGTFLTALNVGVANSVFSATTNVSNENVLSVKTTSNTPALDITPLGSVGIGVSNPSKTLHINGTGILVASGTTTLFSVDSFVANTNILEIKNRSDNNLFFVNNSSVGFGSTNVLTMTPQATQYSLGIGGSEVVRFAVGTTSQNSFSVLSGSGALTYFNVMNSGFVGIGTTNPSQKLHIDGGNLLVTNGGTTVISAGATTTGNVFTVQKRTSSPGFDITGLGSVGIGTTNPSGVFEVNSGSRSLLTVRDTGGTTNSFQVLNNNNQAIFGVTNTNVGIGSTSILTITPQGTVYSVGIATEEIVTLTRNTGSDNIFSVTNAANTLTHLTVSSAGLVGLGTTNPSQRLHVEGNLLVTDGGTEVFSAFKTGTNSLSVVNQSLSPAFDITTAGSVGIGTTQPSSNFQIVSAGSELFSVSSSTGNLLEVGTSSTAFSPPRIFVVSSTGGIGIATTTTSQRFQVGAGSSVVVIDSMGELGIGTTSPRVQLDVIGSANISGVTTLGLTVSTAPSTNSTMSFELTNNTTLTVRVKGSDGTTRIGIITLS